MVLETIDHPNQERYPGQRIFVILLNDYVYLVPFVESGKEIFLKTIIPSRKAMRTYGREKVVSRIPDQRELNRLSKIARDTLKRKRSVNIKLSEHDLRVIRRKAIQEGLPYETLISSLIHKYTRGILVEKKDTI
jgi:predicted DNA binding CopG/RHH family protein